MTNLLIELKKNNIQSFSYNEVERCLEDLDLPLLKTVGKVIDYIKDNKITIEDIYNL